MIKDNDTLPYHGETMEFRENGDTFYSAPCRTFEMIRGKIINQTDEQCLRQGAWTITDSSGNYRTGNYKDNKEACIWKQFDKNGKILRLTENVSFGHDTYRVKEIDYTSGQPLTITNKPFLSFYIKNLVAIMVILFTAFFSRIFINNTIYNRENGTSHSPFYIGLPFTKKYWEKSQAQSKMCIYILVFIYKPETENSSL
ncbi:MAG: hypothetical protein IPL24_08430 [Bacteroidetes bacterium]|nr:hypothetical protein [Bacteroidota bacterium]